MKKLLLMAALAASVAFAQPPAKKPDAKTDQKVQEETKPQTDPVCGMTVEPKTAEAKYAYKGKMYYFCSKEDEQTFEKAPDKYAKK